MREVILQLIDTLGLKQYEFAKEIGVNPSYLNQLLSENGTRSIGISVIERIKARYPEFDTNSLFVLNHPITFGSNENIYQKENNKSINCKRCEELEHMLSDSKDTVATLKRVIESNTLLFENMNALLLKKGAKSDDN